MAKVALLIGVSEYEPGLNPLPAAVKDIEAMQELLLNPEIGSFAEPDVIVLKNPERQAMEEAIESLFAGRHKDDLVMFFFSGHGIKDDTGRLYLATRGTRKTPQGDLIRSTAVSSNILHDSMSRSRSKRQAIILDCCFSGAFAEGLSAKDDGTVDIRAQLGGEGRAVLTSSSSTQYSFEHEGSELSLYTRFLVEGIKTGAADQDEDEVVSIDELHDYASKRVREIKPEAKPEIFAIREGFKIRLLKVPPGDPRQKYRKEVARYIRRGEISLIGRRTLDWKQTELGLDSSEAKAIEDEVLAPYRQKFREKLREYEQAFTDLLQHHETISEEDHNDLQHLQCELGLRNEDILPIQAKVTAQFKAHQQKLQNYEQAFTKAVQQEYPLSQSKHNELRQLRLQLELADTDVALIENRIKTEVEVHHRNLQQYQQSFAAAIQEQYPLSDSKRNELRQQQQNLKLNDISVAPIEAQLITEIESYQQKIEQYEQAFVKATQRKYQPNETVRTQLQQTWQMLGLRQVDVKAIEAQIIAQIDRYQTNLQQYEQEFIKATERQYPLSQAKLYELKQRQQDLNLDDEDTVSIETRITSEIEEQLKKLQQYEKVFSESIQYEYPLTDETRDELKRFQQILGLSDEIIGQIEEQVLSSKDIVLNSSIFLDSDSSVEQPRQATSKNAMQLEALSGEQLISKTTETHKQENQYLQPLQQYEREVIKWIQFGISLRDSQIRKRLNSLRITLGLSSAQAEALELRLSENNRPLQTNELDRAEELDRRALVEGQPQPTQSQIRTRSNYLRQIFPQILSLQHRRVLLFPSIAIASFLLAAGIWSLTRPTTNTPATNIPATNIPATNSSSSNPTPAQEQPTSIQNRVSFGNKILIDREEGNPENPAFEAAKQRGAAAMDKGNYQQAVIDYTEAIREHQNAPETLIYLNNAQIGSERSYVIAVSVPISGPSPGQASEMLRGFAQAQNEINQAGGINGVRLKLKIFDDSDNPEIAKQVASAIVQDSEVLAVMGHWSSGTSLETAPIYDAGKIPFATPISTTIKLSDFSPYVFRTNANTYTGGRALANYALTRLNKRKIAIFLDSKSAYSQELESQFSADIKQGGGEITDRFDLSDSSLSIANSIDQAIERGAQAILLVPAPTSVDRALQVVTTNRRRLPLLGEMANLYTSKTLEVGGKDAVGMVMVLPWNMTGDPDSDFSRKARELWKADVSWATAMSYNAAQAMIEALRRETSPSRAGIQETLTASDFSANGVSGEFRFQSGDANTSVQPVEIRSANPSRSGTGYDFVPVR